MLGEVIQMPLVIYIVYGHLEMLNFLEVIVDNESLRELQSKPQNAETQSPVPHLKHNYYEILLIEPMPRFWRRFKAIYERKTSQ